MNETIQHPLSQSLSQSSSSSRRKADQTTTDDHHDDDNKGQKDVLLNETSKRQRVVDQNNVQIDNGNDTKVDYYQGFSFQKNATTTTTTTKGSEQSVDVISGKDMTGPTFFRQYISQRKPCVVDSLPRLDYDGNDKTPNGIRITRQLLVDVAGDKMIQVERRHTLMENFGQNRTKSRQVTMTVQDFLRRLLDSNNDHDDDSNNNDNTNRDDDNGALYYWSTQEDTDDPFNVPCRQLLDQKRIPSTLALAGNMILSSCNLWMGRTTTSSSNSTTSSTDNNQVVVPTGGASSGLHHDYHDNFYLLLKGRKRFRLLSPDCGPYLATYGTMDRIHFNGRISYIGDECRPDGVPLTELSSIPFGNNDNENDDDDDEEEELVIGKGFDYVSDDDDSDRGAVLDNESDQKDDFDDIMGIDDGDTPAVENGKVKSATTVDDDDDDDDDDNEDGDDRHPNNFSRIDPCRTDRDTLYQEFPSFASCVEVMVELEAGQMLFLPAGWFHEVTSYSNHKATTAEDDNDDDGLEHCHMALNYWYHPPDALENYNNPYQDNFWKKEEDLRLGKTRKTK